MQDILCKGSRLLKPITCIEDARAEREQVVGVQGLDKCLAKLDEAINLLSNCEVNPDELGSLYFLQAQALCLRALSSHEKSYLTEIMWPKETFTPDIEKAFNFVTNTNFTVLAEKYPYLSAYISNLFCLVLDILIMEHDENDHKLLDKIIPLVAQKNDVMCQFQSHHSHLKSELMENYFLQNCNLSMEEGEIREEPEGVVARKAESLKSTCCLAQFYYDEGERMLLMGNMTKALNLARKGRKCRRHLLENNFDLKFINEKRCTVHMKPIAAARAWSITFQEFILAPNINFICYLDSLLQETTILELLGDGITALMFLEMGYTLSSMRAPQFYRGRFCAALSRINRKTQMFSLSREELTQAENLCESVSCKKCWLMLKLDISKESVKQKRKNGSIIDVTTAMHDFLLVEDLLKKHLNVEPCGKGRGNSMYRCRCWECTCRFSLLSVLKEKGKDYVYKDETRKARDVFLENMHFVVSLSSLTKLESPRTLHKLFELVTHKEIIVVHGTHIAELIYIISWASWMIGESDGDFLVSNETLIANLKHALILSSETPELHKKVAQLLTIMCLPCYNKTPLSISENSLTQCHWAGFFHQLTVGSGVNYLLSRRLFKMYGARYDPADELHMLTTSSDVDLNKFVSKFYSQLQPHNILVMNILGDKYKKLLRKGRSYVSLPKRQCCVPSEDSAYLMISRFSSTRKPLVEFFQVNPEGSGRAGDAWVAPWGTDTIVDKILPGFRWIVRDCENMLDAHLEGRLIDILCHMESWLDPHKDILLGEPVDSSLPFIPSLTTKPKPAIILVLDKDIQMLPWESVKVFANQDIYRMPSVSSIFYTYLKCKISGRHVVRDQESYATLDPSNAFYVINPEGRRWQECFLSRSLKNEFGLEGICQEPVKDIIKILETRDLFIFVGHDGGDEHISADELEELERCAAAILMGCSSGLLVLDGPYTQDGHAINYLLAGSPIFIGNLWDISQDWALALTKALVESLIEGTKDEAGIVTCLNLAKQESTNIMCKAIPICYGVPTLLQKKVP